jgi:hypothetical protein
VALDTVQKADNQTVRAMYITTHEIPGSQPS